VIGVRWSRNSCILDTHLLEKKTPLFSSSAGTLMAGRIIANNWFPICLSY
jgi:hypothetical protein